MKQHNRNWDKLKGTKRSHMAINKLELWGEQVIPAIEKESEGLVRPEKQLIFLFGDPTAYKMFQTPEIYKEIAKDAVGKIDGYTNFEGDLGIRRELVKELSSERWQLDVDDVIMTAGGTQSLFFAALSLAKKGDQILVPRPTFPILSTFATFFGIEIVFYDLTPGNWSPNAEQLEELYQTHSKIKFIMINSPSNPLGSVFSAESINQIMRFCERHSLPIVSDEIYEEMVFQKQEFKFLSDFSDTVPIIRCSGLTKRCLVPGWRLGWIALFGKHDVFKQVKVALKQLTNIFLMPNTICQVASTEVYKLSQEIMPEKMIAMEQMYQVLLNGMKDAYGLTVGETNGALYATVIIDPTKFEDLPSSEEFAKKIQKEENFLVFPGELFYGTNFIRLVICQDVENIQEACIRLKRFALRHKKLN